MKEKNIDFRAIQKTHKKDIEKLALHNQQLSKKQESLKNEMRIFQAKLAQLEGDLHNTTVV